MALSDKTLITVNCPKCGYNQNVIFWKSLNATIDPEAKHALLQGTFHMFHCERCGHEAFLDAGFLYHDMEKKFTIRYCPITSLDDNEFLDLFNVNGEMDMQGLGLDNVRVSEHLARPHIVFDMSEVIHYIVFRDKLYERNKQ